MNEEEVREFWHSYDMHRHGGPQRRGQAMMNALHDVAPELYADVSGTERDCFYLDSRISAFCYYLGI